MFDHKLVNERVNEIVNKNLEDLSSVPSENLAIPADSVASDSKLIWILEILVYEFVY